MMWNKKRLLIGIFLPVVGIAIYLAKGPLTSLFPHSMDSLGKMFATADMSALGRNKLAADIFTMESATGTTTTAIKSCSFETSASPERSSVILNEIAWMGTADDAKNEWIEMKNISSETRDAGGLELLNKNGKIKIVFQDGAKIPANGFYLVGTKKNIAPGAEADLVYRGALRNSGDDLRLFDSNCRLMDEVIAASAWPAGSDVAKKTMERDTETLAWHTSVISGGTPKKENTSTPKPPAAAMMKATTEAVQQQQTTTASAPTGTTVAANQTNGPVNTQPPLCPMNSPKTLTHSVLINEVAWAGISSDRTSNEWIELKNNSGQEFSLDGWQLQNSNQAVKVFFATSDTIADGGFYLLERGNADFLQGLKADKFFVNAIKNSDEAIRLFDKNCNVIDEVAADAGTAKNWPAGTASPDYRTAERSHDLSWQTYSGSGINGLFGTPRAENSPVLTASAPSQSEPPPPPVPSPTSTDVSSPPPAPASSSIDHLLISEIMIGIDGNSSYTFVEFYNPTANPVDLTGWVVKKKASTGTESSLIVADRLNSKIVQPGKYFLTANDTGYTGTVLADVKWPSSYTLAYTNNSVEAFNNLGEKIEEVDWVSIPKNESYERDSWSGASFHLQTVPNPQNSQSQ